MIHIQENTQLKSKIQIHSFESAEAINALSDHQAYKLENVEILWCKYGTGTVQADGKSMPLEENQIYCFLPGQLRKFQLDAPVGGYYISFSPDCLYLAYNLKDMMSSFEESILNMQLLSFRADEEMQEELEEIVKKMQRECAGNLWMRSEVLSGLLNVFMIYLSRELGMCTQAQVLSREGDVARKFMTMLKKHFITRKKVADYADALSVTPNYLNAAVKKVTGFTASYQIHKQIIIEAKRRILYADTSLKEIAFDLGFDNQAHFSKFFKSKTGMNYTAYKHSMAEMV
ncbi:helix-turn-helix domain-containing protein [Chitinophaga rhizophila]|uniref:Helix-turn-helix domain-containing protein n=1 Tax=Chitinophaga rhizophila TaxID=2866212 RepID=A0ABS7G852_9BACT|nr:helix-turn-helix domain-containing protein [Chitinophaga rhizophila]MBW8683842.1 helix-turn-helix domain-containing protein [Chitinophaga rhizophila]